MKVNGVHRRVLVDTGCTRCIAYAQCCKRWRKQQITVTTVSGEQLRCLGVSSVTVQPPRGRQITVEAIVTQRRPLDFDFILGMSGIAALGGIAINDHGKIQFGNKNAAVCASADARIRIEKKDFDVTYDPIARSWTAAWKWSNGMAPEVLRNTRKEYPPAEGARASYENELKSWIQNGCLVPYDEVKFGPPKALIPLMAVTQRSKNKVRPVLDFREVNTHIDAFTANCDVCSHKLRNWRRQGTNVSILDLKKAYLQVHVDESLWPYQTVIIKGRRYCLTRLGFGLNVAPTIMQAVVERVLSLAPDIQKGASAYIDDIFVNEDIVAANKVVRHLERYGLSCKAPERIANGARVLGLKVWRERDGLVWSRGKDIGELPIRLTRRTVFSYCGELVGHYPVCGWLRTAAAFIKREANGVTSRWDEPIRDSRIHKHLQDIVSAVKNHDPVRGKWDVSGNKARVWVDASAMALAAALEIDGTIVEDGAWLRPDDARHINMAELDAVIRGLNLAISWQVTTVELMTDSLTVHRWVDDGLSGRTRLRTKAANEMLIRRRVATIVALTKEYGLNVTITLVKSANNKADALTRVPREWLAPIHHPAAPACAAAANAQIEQLITEVHHISGHPGVKRTLYFARRRDPTISKRCVSRVVSECDVCRSTDPAPVKWRHGTLEVDKVWQRVSLDVTHCKGKLYVSLIDCGPSRFAVWRPLRFHASADIIEQLDAVFFERGAPEELLADNDTAFRSQAFAEFVKRWAVRLRFRCAYAPSGNGIVERCHRTVKVIAARKNCSVNEAVYRYNLMPRDDCSVDKAPANAVYRYSVRVRGVDPVVADIQSVQSPYSVGDRVWVKPPRARCDSKYQKGTVTGVLSNQAVEVDGTPRHVRDLRRRTPSSHAPDERPKNHESDWGTIAWFPTQQPTEPTYPCDVPTDVDSDRLMDAGSDRPMNANSDRPMDADGDRPMDANSARRRTIRRRKPRAFECCDS
uniref:Integrase catalytic domain-containing protein n=1 Tax=Trichuris muris TaxID=70415 RepID=A0A5S6Q3K8_TRIMR